MKRNTLFCFGLMSLTFLFAGCKKDMISQMNSLPIVAERFNGDGKAFIDDVYACWEDGDQIRISKTSNGTDYDDFNGAIAIEYPSGVPVASASASGFTTSEGDIVNVAYPQDLFGGVSIQGGARLVMPDHYNYVETNGKQKIQCPMVGSVQIQHFESGQTNPNVLMLRNLCCMLKIQLDRPSSGAFVVDKIAIVNQTQRTAMSGFAKIVYSGDTPELQMFDDASENDRIILDFASNAVAINETKYFYIPIPPQAEDQNLMILIHNQLTGNWMNRVIRTQQAIPGNSMATIEGPSTEDVTPYTFYDYLVNNNNTSKINLGVIPTNNMKMEITFSVPSGYMSGSQYYTGSRPGDANTQIYFGLSASGNDTKFRAHFCSYPQGNETGANYVMSRMNREAGVKYRQTLEVKQAIGSDSTNWYYASVTFEKLDNQGNTVAIETHRTGSKYGGIPADATSINVFSLGQVYQPKMKLYSYRIWGNGVLLYNFVPAKNSENHSGVYDMTGTLTNPFIEGTGSFTAADDPSSK